MLTTKVGLPDGGATWVAVTHMQAGHSRSSAAVRADQVRQLLDVVDSLDGPALVMGDFNLYDDLDEDIASARLLGDRGYTDVALQSGALDPTYRTGTERLDRIYARSGPRTDLRGFEARVGRRKSLSDHLPVEARVRLCRAPVAAHSASDAGIRSAGPLAPLRTP